MRLMQRIGAMLLAGCLTTAHAEGAPVLRDVTLTLRGTHVNAFDATFAYGDALFDAPADQYNHALAQLSLGMAVCAFSTRESEAAHWADEGLSCERQAHIADALEKLGFIDAQFPGYEIPLSDSNSKVAYAIAHRTIHAGTGSDAGTKPYDLIAVILRGGGYGAEWGNNFLTGAAGLRHQAFGDASAQVLAGIERYAAAHCGTGRNIKIWIAGYSRGAAVANLTAAGLNDAGLCDPQNLYAYTFATPRCVLTRAANADDARYGHIFNIINPGDMVPMFPPAHWGFGRYGRDIPLPGTHLWTDGVAQPDPSVDLAPATALYEGYTQVSLTRPDRLYTNEYAQTLQALLEGTGQMLLTRAIYAADFQQPMVDLFRLLSQPSAAAVDAMLASYEGDGVALRRLYNTLQMIDTVRKLANTDPLPDSVYDTLWLFPFLLSLQGDASQRLREDLLSPRTVRTLLSMWQNGMFDNLIPLAASIAPAHTPEIYLAHLMSMEDDWVQ